MSQDCFILVKSLVNVHCTELDSLVVKDAPFMVRMFVARPQHQLWRNKLGEFSVAVHPHHCDVTLIPIMGEVYNITPDAIGSHTRWLTPFRYVSHITDPEHAGFTPVCPQKLPIGLRMERITRPLFMRAEDLHTVYVPHGQVAAWWVIEGKENPSHDPVVWSDAELEGFTFAELNQPMSEERLREDLALIGIGRGRAL